MPVLPGSKWSFIDIRISGYSALPIRGNPNSRYIQYLPFDFDDGNRHSLTVYSISLSMTCIQVDGNPKTRLGRPSSDSCPVTFELEPYKTIRSIHVIIRRSEDPFFAEGAFLLVTWSLQIPSPSTVDVDMS